MINLQAYTPNSYNRYIRPIILTGLYLIFFCGSQAQIAATGGANYCYVRNNNLLENQKPLITIHYGLSIRYYPIKKLPYVSVQNELIFNQKGYKQELDKNYTFRFDYISLPIIINYAPVKFFSINTGVELSLLYSTNVEQGTKTYNTFDTGLILGITCFEKRRLNLYSRITYGLLPMLNYYSIDKLGNFTGDIHDLKNLCISAGLKLNIYNDEIHLYK